VKIELTSNNGYRLEVYVGAEINKDNDGSLY
jgi:hypothetical protein